MDFKVNSMQPPMAPVKPTKTPPTQPSVIQKLAEGKFVLQGQVPIDHAPGLVAQGSTLNRLELFEADIFSDPFDYSVTSKYTNVTSTEHTDHFYINGIRTERESAQKQQLKFAYTFVDAVGYAAKQAITDPSSVLVEHNTQSKDLKHIGYLQQFDELANPHKPLNLDGWRTLIPNH